MAELVDPEFGTIQIVKSSLARYLSVKLLPNRQLRLTSPVRLTARSAQKFINNHRSEIRQMIDKASPNHIYQPGDRIGQQHLLKTEPGKQTKVFLRNNYLVVQLPPDRDIAEVEIQNQIRPVVVKALRQQARRVLPPRLSFLARQYGFYYQRNYLSHASTRWGSYTGRGTISLNIALMKLPAELIDYVIIHELCHTRHPNHSKQFWLEVERILPNFRQLRRRLKEHSPVI